MKYHIWTFGGQMNTADSQRLASELERMGHTATDDSDAADILVVNTCVVRQSAEDKAMNRLMMLRSVKQRQPDKVVGVMGCLVGVRGGQVREQPAGPYADDASQGPVELDVFHGPLPPHAHASMVPQRRPGGSVRTVARRVLMLRLWHSRHAAGGHGAAMAYCAAKGR